MRFLVVACFLYLAGCALYTLPFSKVSEADLTSVKCTRVEFSDIFQQPEKLVGTKICTFAYVYTDYEFIGFSGEPVEGFRSIIWRDENIFLTSDRHNFMEDLSGIPQGSRVFLKGRMYYAPECWQMADDPAFKGKMLGCTPNPKGVELRSAHVYYVIQ